MKDIIVIVILAVIVLLAAGYIYKAKKSGKKCIGCPGNSRCGSQCGGTCDACSGCGDVLFERWENDDTES